MTLSPNSPMKNLAQSINVKNDILENDAYLGMVE